MFMGRFVGEGVDLTLVWGMGWLLLTDGVRSTHSIHSLWFVCVWGHRYVVYTHPYSESDFFLARIHPSIHPDLAAHFRASTPWRQMWCLFVVLVAHPLCVWVCVLT